MQSEPTGKKQASAERPTSPATSRPPRSSTQVDPATKTQLHAEGPTNPATPRRFRRHSAIRPCNQDTSEGREADQPSHSAPALQAHRNSAPHGRRKLTQRSRQAQPLRTDPASIMQSEPTGKTQMSTERPTCPATPHRPREHNAIRLPGEDASERGEADVLSHSTQAPQAQRGAAFSAAGAATIPAACPARQFIPAARPALPTLRGNKRQPGGA